MVIFCVVGVVSHRDSSAVITIVVAQAENLASCELLISEKDIKAINVKKKSRYLYEELIFIIFRSLLL
jgi:hypothetical protein